MKAISLWQPYATLIALNKKRIETRSWPTDYRGQLAIHATKSAPEYAAALCRRGVFADALDMDFEDLPFGAVVATCELVACEQILMFTELPASPEFDFGNYGVGRFMWMLSNIQQLDEPVPARGGQRLWEWQPPR